MRDDRLGGFGQVEDQPFLLQIEADRPGFDAGRGSEPPGLRVVEVPAAVPDADVQDAGPLPG